MDIFVMVQDYSYDGQEVRHVTVNPESITGAIEDHEDDYGILWVYVWRDGEQVWEGYAQDLTQYLESR